MTHCCRLALLLLPCLLLLPAAAKQDKPEKEVRARIGAWNIEWLGNPTKRRKAAQKPEDIADYLTASKVELLGLSEVSTDGETEGQPTNSILTEACKLLKGKERGDWRHVLFPSEEKDNKDQLCGVAWNASRWQLVEKPFRVPLRRTEKTGEDIWRRHPYAAKFSHGDKLTDVVLIPVHQKSNRGGGVTQQGKVRAEEALLLIRSLGAVQNHFKDDDVVVLGDFNCLLREEPALLRYRSAGFRDLNFADQLSWIKDRQFDPAPFDRILVPDEQPEFRDCGFTVFRDHGLDGEKDFRDRLSDHYLVSTDLRIMADDD